MKLKEQECENLRRNIKLTKLEELEISLREALDEGRRLRDIIDH